LLSSSNTYECSYPSGTLKVSIDPSESPANIQNFSLSYKSIAVIQTLLSIDVKFTEVKSFITYKGINQGYMRSSQPLSTLQTRIVLSVLEAIKH
jgi:hypothetical protein